MAQDLSTGYASTVDFLERLNAEDRERLLAASSAVHISQGETLLRRGECSGDIYWVEAGSLEIVDTRQRPELVLDVLGPGSVLGEMAFVDSGPRTADVRALSQVVCRHWGHVVLHRLLDGDQDLNARFYRALSGAVVARSRSQQGIASVGGIGRLVQEAGPVPVAVVEKAREIADVSRQRWMDSEAQLRVSATDASALQQAQAAVNVFVEAIEAWIRPMTDQSRAVDAGAALRKEVQPYMGRAKLVFLAQEAGLGANGAEFMAHLLLGEPAGDGPLGEVIDRALLALPTAAGLRARQRTAIRAAMERQTDEGALAVTLVHPNCGALLAQLVSRLTGRGGVVTVIDGDRETLGVVDLGMQTRPQGVELRLVQEDLALLATGRSTMHHPPQDIFVIDGLVDHLPDRLVIALAAWCADHLAPGGELVVTGSSLSTDAEIFDHVVGWPLVRRSPGELLSLLESAGLKGEEVPVEAPVSHAGVVVKAGLRPEGLPRS